MITLRERVDKTIEREANRRIKKLYEQNKEQIIKAIHEMLPDMIDTALKYGSKAKTLCFDPLHAWVLRIRAVLVSQAGDIDIELDVYYQPHRVKEPIYPLKDLIREKDKEV